MKAPTVGDLKELKKIVRYLAGTLDVVWSLEVNADQVLRSVVVKG